MKRRGYIISAVLLVIDLLCFAFGGVFIALAAIIYALGIGEHIARVKYRVIPCDPSLGVKHTFATRCFDEGINPKIVQAYLGHKSVNTTLDIYTDINESQKTHNILMLEDAMNETIRRRAE